MPKAGRRATFGRGRNSAKLWRHLAVSGLGSLHTLSIYIVCDDASDLKGKLKRPKTHQITQDNAENSG